LKNYKNTTSPLNTVMEGNTTTQMHCPDYRVPRSQRQVQQFLGLANYYRRFVHNFAEIAKPLHRLTEKTVPLQ